MNPERNYPSVCMYLKKYPRAHFWQALVWQLIWRLVTIHISFTCLYKHGLQIILKNKATWKTLISTKFTLFFFLRRIFCRISIKPADKNISFSPNYLRPRARAPLGWAVLTAAHLHLCWGADRTQGMGHHLLSLESPFLDTLNETTLLSSSTRLAACAPFTCWPA